MKRDGLGAGHDNLAAGHDNLAAGHLGAGHDNLGAGHDNLAAGHDNLSAIHDNLAAGHDDLSAGHDAAASHDDLGRDHDDFGGLMRDLEMLSRRRMLGFMAKTAAGISLAPLLAACGDNFGAGADGNTDGDGNADSAPDTTSEACSRIPSETAGPYPGDGTNGPNALTLAGIERSDIRASIGAASGTADGIAFTCTLTLVGTATCAPLAGYAVYIWHCTRGGDYSMYTGAAQSENYLRGVQVTDAAGKVTFTTVVPGCYPGRWPHIHVEIYSSSSATNASKVAVSQLALPEATCNDVYATTGYEQSTTNLSQISLADDTVFRDGSSLQMVTITGSVAAANLAGMLTLAIAV